MAPVAHTWYAAMQKILAFLSTICGILVIVASSYASYKLSTDTSDIHNITNTTPKIESGESSQEMGSGGQAGKAVEEGHEEEHMSVQYKQIFLICTIIAMSAGGLQVLVSFGVISRCTKKIARTTQVWLIIHFLIFLINLACLLLPMSFSKHSGDPHGVKELTYNMKKDFEQALHIPDIHKYIFEDNYYNYYTVCLVIDEIVIVSLMILDCCLMRLGLHDYETLDNTSMSKYN